MNDHVIGLGQSGRDVCTQLLSPALREKGTFVPFSSPPAPPAGWHGDMMDLVGEVEEPNGTRLRS